MLGSNNVIGVQPNPLEKPERYRNVISGNGSNGVYVYGSTSPFPMNNRIEGNYIGTDASGAE